MGDIHRKLTSPHAGARPVPGITIGVVVDTDDPQQQGRIRVSCPALNDIPPASPIFKKTLIPWATYVPSFGGISNIARGPDEVTSDGPVAYGEWTRPEPGDYAVIACVDGDSQYRICLGSLHAQYLTHTLPRGRYFPKNGELDGPFTSTESPIQPLYDNITSSFNGRANFEWHTRGAETQATQVSADVLDRIKSNEPDFQGEITMPDGSKRTLTQGYSSRRPRIFTWGTPGFHSLLMNDDPNNCRIKLQTTTGHQIILDDSNERIFIGTNTGDVWHEMDAKGNVDTHSELRISYHSVSDVNVTSDKSIRMHAKEDVHITADRQIRMHAGADLNIITDKNARVKATESIKIESEGASDWLSGDTLSLESAKDSSWLSGTGLNIEAKTTLNLLGLSAALTGLSGVGVNGAGGQVLLTGSAVHLNGPPAPIAAPAPSAAEAAPAFAYSTSRVPIKLCADGKPWARVSMDPSKTDNDDSSNLTIDYYDQSNMEFDYLDPNCNRVDLGTDLKRGKAWKR